ncbi:MAG: transposase [Proteobacteria bacterium]|nr:transposase [Pseudomonadota bacterium]
MGRSRYKTFDSGNTYFITSSVINWLPLFAIPQCAEIVVDSLAFMHQDGRMTLHAWVIMETHIHVVASSHDMSSQVRNMKSFTAKAVVAYLDRNGPSMFLNQMRFYKKKHKCDQAYQVWQEGFHPEQILDEVMMSGKIDYVHYNPVKRGYVDRPEHWRYSSARDYAGDLGLVPIEKLVL